MSQITVTTLIENTAMGRGILGEHGLAFWIDAGDKKLLFDSGQGIALLLNAKALGIDLSTADALIFSHSHYDHVGGSEYVINKAHQATLYFHPQARGEKYHLKAGCLSKVSIPFWEGPRINDFLHRTVYTSSPTNIANGISVTGQIPRRTDFEDTGGAFFLDEAATLPDPLLDDQALYFTSEAGVVVILGCAHAGTVNTLNYVSELTGSRKIFAVMGGAHLVNASQERIDRTIEAFREFNVQRIGLGHCTGMAATVAFWNAFPGRCFSCSAGSTIRIKSLSP